MGAYILGYVELESVGKKPLQPRFNQLDHRSYLIYIYKHKTSLYLSSFILPVFSFPVFSSPFSSVTGSPRRYISDETVVRQMEVSSMSRRRHGQTDKGRKVLLVTQKDYIGSWFSSREEPAISLWIEEVRKHLSFNTWSLFYLRLSDLVRAGSIWSSWLDWGLMWIWIGASD